MYFIGISHTITACMYAAHYNTYLIHYNMQLFPGVYYYSKKAIKFNGIVCIGNTVCCSSWPTITRALQSTYSACSICNDLVSGRMFELLLICSAARCPPGIRSSPLSHLANGLSVIWVSLHIQQVQVWAAACRRIEDKLVEGKAFTAFWVKFACKRISMIITVWILKLFIPIRYVVI